MAWLINREVYFILLKTLSSIEFAFVIHHVLVVTVYYGLTLVVSRVKFCM